MAQVKILPEILSNKIAAGEVVERPASVVKELLENAIDAHSRKIMIQIEQGGRRKIQIADNGIGMGHDDALLSIERYATSKLKTDNDLFAIKTLGFRGEALPSIASVSKFNLVTRDQNSETGTEIQINGGKLIDVKEVGTPIGTVLTVQDLFFNTPARKKFLKSTTTEMGHIIENFTRTALCWPQTHFHLIHNQKTVKNWTGGKKVLDRALDVFGASIAPYLLEINHKSSDLSVNGFIAKPQVYRSTSKNIFVYVNQRFIRDRRIQHAIFEGYRGRLIRGQFPLAIIFLSLPFDQVDVNVHPTKHEVRLVEQRKILSTIRELVSSSLSQSEKPTWVVPSEDIEKSKPDPKSFFKPEFKTNSQAELNSEIFESQKQYPMFSNAKPFEPDEKVDLPASPPLFQSDSEPQKSFFKNTTSTHMNNLRIIGQYRHSYIICESKDGLLLVDQHAAHERIVYEKLKTVTFSNQIRKQKLLLPETLEFGFREVKIVTELLPKFAKLGVDIEHFGGNTFIVTAIPSLLDPGQLPLIIHKIIDLTIEYDSSPQMEEILDDCLKIMACHGAVRAHQKVTEQEMVALLNELMECTDPAHCPHGRPTWVKWEKQMIEKAFKRIN